MTPKDVLKICEEEGCCPLGLAVRRRGLARYSHPGSDEAADMLGIPRNVARSIMEAWDHGSSDSSALMALNSGILPSKDKGFWD